MITGNTFQEKLLEVGRIIEHRTIIRRTQKQKDVIHPRDFGFVTRDGKLLCVWFQNIGRPKIGRKTLPNEPGEKTYGPPITNPHLGMDPDEWIEVTKGLCMSLGDTY